MYTGTMIQDLLRTVERAEINFQQKRAAEEMELLRLFELRSPQEIPEQIFAGAA
jgi:hypothetical protein